MARSQDIKTFPVEGALLSNPDCAGTVGKDFVACGEEGYYCSNRCWTIGRLRAAREQVAEYERQLGVYVARDPRSVILGGNLEDSGWLLISAADLPREIDTHALNHVMYCIERGAVFLELDPERCQEALAWLKRLTGAVARLQCRLSHPILIVISPDTVWDRATRDQIVCSGGMPIYAPETYSRHADREVRLHILGEYVRHLRAPMLSVGRRGEIGGCSI